MSQRELNMLQRHWIELLKDYHCKIEYRLWKANLVLNALCQKSNSTLAHMQTIPLFDLIALRAILVNL